VETATRFNAVLGVYETVEIPGETEEVKSNVQAQVNSVQCIKKPPPKIIQKG